MTFQRKYPRTLSTQYMGIGGNISFQASALLIIIQSLSYDFITV